MLDLSYFFQLHNSEGVGKVMDSQKVAREEFEQYIQKGSMFDQISWRLRPDHIQANGLMTREQLVDLVWHFYVYGFTDSFKILEKAKQDADKIQESTK